MILHQTNVYIEIINNHLKTYRSDISIDCIWETWNGITITTSKVTSVSDLSIIEKYFKRLKNICHKLHLDHNSGNTQLILTI